MLIHYSSLLQLVNINRSRCNFSHFFDEILCMVLGFYHIFLIRYYLLSSFHRIFIKRFMTTLYIFKLSVLCCLNCLVQFPWSHHFGWDDFFLFLKCFRSNTEFCSLCSFDLYRTLRSYWLIFSILWYLVIYFDIIQICLCFSFWLVPLWAILTKMRTIMTPFELMTRLYYI